MITSGLKTVAGAAKAATNAAKAAGCRGSLVGPNKKFSFSYRKKVVEDWIHRARTGGLELCSTQVEAKWDSI
ncbi:hypothetical protein MTR67_038489 [Solanum verrucosum]|uniref:Uncharacterized protein n=1 Tax=Solanum verrucosum TaxID=315347 RepID=A0AAF0UGX6_SOLVR|nr:hypothetical protein MTR67_038489 [Solanum verrucosum]